MQYIQTFEGFLNEASVPAHLLTFAKKKGATSFVQEVAGWVEKAGKKITGGTAVGKNYDTLVLDMEFEGGEIRINLDKKTVELFDEEVRDAKSFAKLLASYT